MKLHLGCGENYLAGYVNIDFPAKHHSVQTKRVADRYTDIFKLRYPQGSIEEIRLHHVFEHFQRAIACALLVCWREWLINGGILRLEVPDFVGTASTAISRQSNEHAKNVALRHIFGSQEAAWATHYEGWSKAKLGELLKRYQYEVVRTDTIKYKSMFNIEIFARKEDGHLNKTTARTLTQDFLTTHLVDRSPSENRLLSIWMKTYDSQIRKCWPKR